MYPEHWELIIFDLKDNHPSNNFGDFHKSEDFPNVIVKNLM